MASNQLISEAEIDKGAQNVKLNIQHYIPF